ncbi:hypothetical protein OPT61_g1744 [Boeremia exigua]|uniref:Uncharacterized protein n=1 Tax=Boeremia exigua TaxID=749465 RepID=A0ACC2INZ1_9PLEO|nr:hypothetical protein OPT61_g1744 [Boeremia exigua]
MFAGKAGGGRNYLPRNGQRNIITDAIVPLTSFYCRREQYEAESSVALPPGSAASAAGCGDQQSRVGYASVWTFAKQARFCGYVGITGTEPSETQGRMLRETPNNNADDELEAIVTQRDAEISSPWKAEQR